MPTWLHAGTRISLVPCGSPLLSAFRGAQKEQLWKWNERLGLRASCGKLWQVVASCGKMLLLWHPSACLSCYLTTWGDSTLTSLGVLLLSLPRNRHMVYFLLPPLFAALENATQIFLRKVKSRHSSIAFHTPSYSHRISCCTQEFMPCFTKPYSSWTALKIQPVSNPGLKSTQVLFLTPKVPVHFLAPANLLACICLTLPTLYTATQAATAELILILY